MKLLEFNARLKTIKIGDYVSLLVRGNYGNYVHKGILVKVQNGRVYLRDGCAHSYKRINSIGLTIEEEPKNI